MHILIYNDLVNWNNINYYFIIALLRINIRFVLYIFEANIMNITVFTKLNNILIGIEATYFVAFCYIPMSILLRISR